MAIVSMLSVNILVVRKVSGTVFVCGVSVSEFQCGMTLSPD